MMYLVKEKPTLEVIVTYMEMTHEPPANELVAVPHDCVVRRVEHPPLDFYRNLYHEVGYKYRWLSRKKLSDKELLKIIHDPNVEIYVLYQDGAPIGFSELDFRKPKQGEIVFLGLMEEVIGKGFGRFLLHEMLKTAWRRDIHHLRLETCTFDHPHALKLYLQNGFQLCGQKTLQIAS